MAETTIMEWNAATWWWVATGVLVAVELATGTFYLLMLAIGTAAAALAAHMGLAAVPQMVAAALVGGGAVAAWHARRERGPAPPPASANRDINLDIGERVQVAQWNTDATTRVQYRGAAWSARFGGTGTAQPGPHVIRAIEGNQLVLEPAAH
jgi:membrane protein implicated in regulation of membrane protease activity